ncbi:MAG: hypothetical protein E7157_00745 [Lactobacillales bacterium]|nr:hypothetical protein [Lactobacillales bacterium]
MKKVIDYDDYFEDYMGLIYYKIINENKIKNINNVVEFAPGFRFKIAYALKRLNFTGTIYVIDSNKKVLEFVKEKYKIILPEAKIVLINKDLIDSIEFLPENIDLFLANHCIDDMIISKYLDGKKLEDAFNNTEKSKQILINCWNELKEEDNILFNIQENVYNDLKKFFEKINFRLIVMSQYKSGYYMNQKNYVEELSKTIFNKLKISINTNLDNLKAALSFDFENFDVALNEGFSLKENIQFSDNWIAGKYK